MAVEPMLREAPGQARNRSFCALQRLLHKPLTAVFGLRRQVSDLRVCRIPLGNCGQIGVYATASLGSTIDTRMPPGEGPRTNGGAPLRRPSRGRRRTPPPAGRSGPVRARAVARVV